MKRVFVIICCLVSLAAFAKNNPLEGFSKALAENIDSVVENNPERFETDAKKKWKNRPSRGPASTKPVSDDKTEKINTFDKLEHGFSKF